MTVQTDELHFEIAGGKWSDAADRCNGLAMFDILPTIFGLSMGERSLLANNGVAALSQRGWTGSAERLRRTHRSNARRGCVGTKPGPRGIH
jgi:hypothetical protein